MASSTLDAAKDFGRKQVDRLESKAGWEYREAKKQAKDFIGIREKKKARKPDPRKYPKSRTASR